MPCRRRLLLPQVIDRQVSCDGEQPRLETKAAVILPRAFQYTQPGFLNEVLGLFTPGCPVDQISEEPIVIPRHHSANEFRVSSPQCTRDALRLGFRHTRKGGHHDNHRLYTRSAPELCMATHLEDPKTFQRALSARVADSSYLAASNLASCPNRNR